ATRRRVSEQPRDSGIPPRACLLRERAIDVDSYNVHTPAAQHKRKTAPPGARLDDHLWSTLLDHALVAAHVIRHLPIPDTSELALKPEDGKCCCTCLKIEAHLNLH